MSGELGPEAAFLTVAEQYRLPLYRYALRVAEDPALAEEAVQEALARAWVAQVKGRPPERWGAWLYRVTHNVVVDEFRRRQHTAGPGPGDGVRRESEAFEAAAPEAGPAEIPSSPAGSAPEEEAERLARRETVRQALALLPDRYRHVLLLREEEGLTYEEIADVLGVRPGNVKVLLHRARASFASLYSALVLVRAAMAGRERGGEGVCGELLDLLAGAPASPASVLADARLRRRVEQHLEGCPACLARREEYRRTGELFGLLPPVVLPPLLLAWRPGEAPAVPEGSAAAAGAAAGSPAGAARVAGGAVAGFKAGGLVSTLKAKAAVLAGLAALAAAAAGIGYAVRVGQGGEEALPAPGAQVAAPGPSGAPAGGPAGGAASGPPSAAGEAAGENGAESGPWQPWGFRAGDRLRYRLVHHADEGPKEGLFSLSLEDAGRGMLEARWEGEWEGRRFSLTQTGPPEAVAGPFSLLALSLGNPAAGAFLAAVSGTLWAPWFVNFQSQVLAPGAGWEFTDDSGAVRSVKVEEGCQEAGRAGWLVVMRTGGKKVAESCLSPRVPLPLSVRLWDEDDGRLRYEAVAVEYRPGG